MLDTPRNRFVKSALEKSAALIATLLRQHKLGETMKKDAQELARKCRQLARQMHEMGVLAPAPLPNSAELENFGRHDSTDRPMVQLSKFVFAMKLPTEKGGLVLTPKIDKPDEWLRILFEKAVLRFFTLDPVVRKEGWQAEGSKRPEWPTEDSSGRIKELLPTMETDIVLFNSDLGGRIVIDTKFTNILGQKHHHEKESKGKLKSGYLYQIYSYVMSQHEVHPHAEGVLLYPQADEEFDEHTTIQGHRFRFVTVDLKADDYQVVLEQLRRLVL